MHVNLKEILKDSEIREVRKKLGRLANQARRQGNPLTDRQKTDLLQQLIAEKVGRDTEPHPRQKGTR